MTSQREKAIAFNTLHRGTRPLVLANVWDVASARIVEAAGYPALATTSSGIAWSLGYTDSETAPLDEMLWVVRQIASRVAVPVSADLLAGYGRTPDDVAQTITKLLATGAVGVNIEDASGNPAEPLRSIDEQVARLRAARAAAEAAGVPLVINARTDVYLRRVGDPGTMFERTVQRANAYLDAGADCAFIIGLRDAGVIARLVQEIHGPINILAGPASPSVAELAQLGVARVSIGGGAAEASAGLVRQIATELRDRGTYTTIGEWAIPHPEMDALHAEASA